ncbi:hypothetical protein [Limibacillus halophilus]|uniref:Uncharacterized protein n=1 Tax=Limibacillus halophilus TaxID=1579333 RepID=A0A839SWF8_9PROT|nr:hypothetical protein [Limibacillus halophilus]MBB3066014.1 hypothetical protein [Limibacillus halophilus]
MRDSRIQPLFPLSVDGYYRLSYDSHQWMIERRNILRPQKGKDSGYRGICYVMVQKSTLLQKCKRLEIPLTVGAKLKLDLLPDRFLVFRAEIERLGVDAYLRRLGKRISERLDRTELVELTPQDA